jgi:Leucine-rich repeat (LRR) protein
LLKFKYPNKDTWENITKIDCSYNKLNNLNGIENLPNLQNLNCSGNNLLDLNGIENLIKIKK